MKVYQYGITNMPKHLPEAAFNQMRLQNQFWNQLVEIENEFQVKYNNLVLQSDEQMQAVADQMAELQARQAEIRAELKKARQKKRGTVKADDATKAELADIKQQLKDLREKRKEIKEEVKEKIRPQVQELDKERKEAVKKARQEIAEAGLYWGNYNAVADSYNRARKGIFRLRAQGQPARMNFHRFTGEGRLTVQLQGGLSVQDLFAGKSGLLQIDPVPEEAWMSPVRSERRRLSKTTGRIRIDSDGRAPVWLEFPVILHRPMPENGSIRFAQLSRKKVGTSWRWRLNITVAEPVQSKKSLPEKALAMDLGWRKLDNGLRVAAWRDSDGNTGEVLLDSSFLRVNERLMGLDSTIDKHFNAIKDNIARWRQAGDLPEWMAEETLQVLNWRAPMRLVRLIQRMWQSEEKPDREIAKTLEAWSRKFLHLYEWQSNLRDKMQGRRREQYRLFARWVSENYNAVIIEEFNIASVSRRKKAEEGSDHAHASRHLAKLGSPGLLRGEIERSCAATGAAVARVDAKDTTRTCIHCGNVVKSNVSQSVDIICDHCGLGYDQDFGAAKNLLERWKADPSQIEAEKQQ